MRERFAAKAEARFLERKNELDQVVYSLLRLENSFLARELYLQIESGESNFADLAKRYAEGPERNTNGIVGPVSLTQAHPVLVEKLRVAQPGFCWNPFGSRIGGWWCDWSVIRLPRSPMRSPTRCAKRCSMLWIDEETAASLSQLASLKRRRRKPPAPSATSASRDDPDTVFPFAGASGVLRLVRRLVSRLERECNVFRFDLGGQLCDPNDISARILVILQGQARLVGRHNGRLTTVGKFGPGSVIGAASLLCGAPCENVIAAEEVIACAISDELWRELYSSEASFRHWCDQQLWPQELLKLLEALEQNTPEPTAPPLKSSRMPCKPQSVVLLIQLRWMRLWLLGSSSTSPVHGVT